ncbi:class I tRNA ligase family protein [Candidatus Nomurabacteria bacterium]|nr:MAG: class I tRNA ligase family protein [Candidatus Nomurabacteria bacterium]
MLEDNEQGDKSDAALRPSSAEKSATAGREEAVLQFWKDNTIFQKSLDKDSPKGEFVFYDGPPTANGKPGIHHLEPRCFKDAFPRYKTMRGFHVRRKGGWDTHGLPVELQVEKELGLKSKKEIESYGIAAFNDKCRESVWKYIDEWERFTDRSGYWVDHKNPYITYKSDFIESIWNIVSKVNDKGLLYKDYKVVPWCPRCGTALSSHELAQGYQDDTDLSVTAKFKIVGTENGYFLAWTTTPWTLPGNVGLAVGKDVVYVEAKVGDEILVLAKERLSVIAEPYEIVAEHTGSEMVGMQYEPLYPYLQNLDAGDEKIVNAYKVYPADFVTTTDGTGIVHTAVMYGQEDFELGTKVGLPKFHLVDEAGHFIKGTDFLEGKFVKDEETAVDVIKDLAHRGLLFKKEKYTHSYPHCWRCKTALIYYARDSWYIRMSELRDTLVAENKKINWEPDHTKEGRFGEWIREVKDWAISRERYWGTPLPIWIADDGESLVVDSYETLKKYTKKSGNQYFVMRHGGTEGNIEGVISFKNQENDHLTVEGKKQVATTAQGLVDKRIDLIVSSPFIRTKETAEILREKLGLSNNQVIYIDELHEIDGGDFDGKNWDEYHQYILQKGKSWFDEKIPGGESLQDVGRRTGKVLYDLEKTYTNKNILIVTHGGPAWALFVNAGLFIPTNKEYQPANSHVFVQEFKRFDNAEVRDLPFVPLPHNENYELDPHRPFIDEIVLEHEGKEFRRVKEVMDVWFDSGAMPFAQDHYPFENKDFVEGPGYPADFISEAIDQTRGWFYTLLAVGVLMDRGTAYKNVICLGHILDKDGKKMSKSIGNVVDPWTVINKYGVDTLRLWMYSVNQPGESKNFDERTVGELQRQVFGLLYNILSFYELYRDTESEQRTVNSEQTKNVLDAWILARLDEVVGLTTEKMDVYKALEPVRAIRDFIGDLSTWYLRRSRDRIKDGDVDAKQTLYTVLKTLAQVMAPFAPFASEDIWQRLRHEADVESVHLSNWPEKAGEPNPVILQNMGIVRDLCTVGNALRKKANIPVRQPLAFFFVTEDLADEYKELIKDELNVKAVEKGPVIVFDERITPELKLEGEYREFVRAVQDLRKQAGLTPSDVIILTISPEAESLVTPFMNDFKKTVLAGEVMFADNNGQEVSIGEIIISINIE